MLVSDFLLIFSSCSTDNLEVLCGPVIDLVPSWDFLSLVGSN